MSSALFQLAEAADVSSFVSGIQDPVPDGVNEDELLEGPIPSIVNVSSQPFVSMLGFDHSLDCPSY